MFGNCRDRKGRVSVDMGFEVTDKKYKIIIYPPTATEPFLYDSDYQFFTLISFNGRLLTYYKGIMKFDVLSHFFEGIINGTVDLEQVREETLAKQQAEKSAVAQGTTEEEIKETSSFGNLEDETLIDESGYGGFDPHGGVDLEYLLKLTGGVNPHAAGHPGGAKADSKRESHQPEPVLSGDDDNGSEEKAETIVQHAQVKDEL